MLRSRSRTKHKPSVLRPNKRIRLSFSEYEELRLAKWEEQHQSCANVDCQRFILLPQWGELHHKIFRSQGGPDTAENTELLCAKCHRRKHIPPKVVLAKPSPEKDFR